MSQRIPRLARGQRISSLRPQLNRIVDRLNAATVSYGSQGAAPGFPPERVMLLQIRNLGASTLTCVLPGEALNPSAQTWEVLLPSTLTEPSRDGVAYVYTDINNRTAGGTEVQKLTPIYLINDFVYVAPIRFNATYVDLNADGRQWARVP